MNGIGHASTGETNDAAPHGVTSLFGRAEAELELDSACARLATAAVALMLAFVVMASGQSDSGSHMAGRAGKTADDGRVRTYYIAADEIDWDYAPQQTNLITGKPFGAAENVFVGRGPDRIGSVYRKAVYRAYTDASFTTPKPVPARWRHLGLLGPVIRAEVGDRIRVVFRNNGSRPYSVHPHGVFYDKDAEGAGYADGTTGAGKDDDARAPRRHARLRLEGAGARRARTRRRELSDVDVPLARRRDCRHQRRAERRDDHHRSRPGAT